MAPTAPAHQAAAAYDDARRVAEYDARMDVMHPNRAHMCDVVCRLIPSPADRPITVVDLGTGTGFLAASVLEAFPNARVIAVDGAAAMMNQARARLGPRAGRMEWRTCVFAELAAKADELPELDAVVSSFALHHLTPQDKLALERAMHRRLRPGGVFVNADILIAPEAAVENTYQSLRRAGIQRRLRATGVEKSTEQIGAELAELERLDGDKPLPVETDLRLLREAGFHTVDCWWKETREAVWGGTK
jgi:ubiquinone/menaquinone biosynthesis C-methylase UbiE